MAVMTMPVMADMGKMMEMRMRMQAGMQGWTPRLSQAEGRRGKPLPRDPSRAQ